MGNAVEDGAMDVAKEGRRELGRIVGLLAELDFPSSTTAMPLSFFN